MISRFFLLIFACTIGCREEQSFITYLEVPGKNQYCKIDTSGTSILPSGRYLSPAGETIRITHDPFGMAISPDGAKAITLHNGVMTVIDLTTLHTTRIPSYDKKIPSPFSNGSFIGVAFAHDSKSAFLS